MALKKLLRLRINLHILINFKVVVRLLIIRLNYVQFAPIERSLRWVELLFLLVLAELYFADDAHIILDVLSPSTIQMLPFHDLNCATLLIFIFDLPYLMLDVGRHNRDLVLSELYKEEVHLAEIFQKLVVE